MRVVHRVLRVDARAGWWRQRRRQLQLRRCRRARCRTCKRCSEGTKSNEKSWIWLNICVPRSGAYVRAHFGSCCATRGACDHWTIHTAREVQANFLEIFRALRAHGSIQANFLEIFALCAQAYFESNLEKSSLRPTGDWTRPALEFIQFKMF